MTKLHLANKLALPLDVVTQKLAFLGRTGSGKTYGASKLAELMLDRNAQVVVLDPVGVWYGLRLGEQPYAIPVFGGLHGDVPLEATGGALIADLIVDRGISAILDVSQMIPAELCRFATDFAGRFFQRKKAKPSAVHVYLEECQEFIPQNPMKGEEKMLHEFQRLVKLGRNFGIGVSMISQRPQEVSKKALNQTECMFAFQMTGPHERKAIAGWVDEKGLDIDVQALLPRLQVGHAHVWSPQWLDFSGEVRIAEKRTADVSSTPKVGDGKRRERALSSIDLEEIRERMSETIERAKQEDPRELRAENAKLKKQVQELSRAAAHNANLAESASQKLKAVKTVEVPVFGKDQLRRLKELHDGFEKTARELEAAIVKAVAEDKKPGWSRVVEAKQRVGALPNKAAFAPAPSVREAPKTNGVFKVGKGGLYRILCALAERPQGLTQQQIGVRAGLSSRSGSFATYLSQARGAGWIDGERGGELHITEAGLSALGDFDRLPSGQGLLEYWLRQFGGSGAARILRAVAEAYPKAVSKEVVGEQTGLSPNSGSFATYCSKLRSLELVSGRGELRASDELFD